MKRIDLMRRLERSGCQLPREGKRHIAYVNRGAKKSSIVPGHREINDVLARKIRDDLQVPQPG